MRGKDASKFEGPVLTRTARSDVFHLPVFLRQSLIQISAPWSTIYMYLFGHGKQAGHHAIHICPKGFIVGAQSMENLILTLNWLLYFVLYDTFSQSMVGGFEIFVFPTCTVLVQRLMIGFKYATLTEEEYHLFKSAPPDVADRWNRNLQLLSGYYPLPDDLLDAELDLSGTLTGVDVSEFNFIHELYDASSCEVWDVWQAQGLTNADATTPLGNRLQPVQSRTPVDTKAVKKIPLRGVMRKLLMFARREGLRVNMRACSIAGLCAGLIPWFARLIWKGEVADCDFTAVGLLDCIRLHLWIALGYGSPVVLYATLVGFWITTKFFTLVTAFVAASLSHYIRMHIMMSSITCFARPIMRTEPWMPQLQLEGKHAEENVMSLVLCFELALRFGRRVKNRLSVYISLVFLVSLALLVFVYIRAGDSTVRAGAATADLQVVSIVVIYGACIFVFLLMSMIVAGAQSNSAFSQLNQYLNSRRWRRFVSHELGIESEQVDKDEGDTANELGSSGLDTAFALAAAKITALEEVDFVDVAGFKATGDLVNGLAWTICPMVAVIIGKLFFPSLLDV